MYSTKTMQYIRIRIKVKRIKNKVPGVLEVPIFTGFLKILQTVQTLGAPGTLNFIAKS